MNWHYHGVEPFGTNENCFNAIQNTFTEEKLVMNSYVLTDNYYLRDQFEKRENESPIENCLMKAELCYD